MTGLKDGCPCGVLTNGLTDLLAAMLPVELLPPEVLADPLDSYRVTHGHGNVQQTRGEY